MKLFLLVFACFAFECVAAQGVIVCYWQSWADGRTAPGDFRIVDFDGNLCTHIVFAFAGVRAEDGEIIDLVDPWRYWEVLDWRDKNYQNLKVLLAVGGYSEGAAKFSEVASNPDKIVAFSKSAVRFVESYGFDGIDMDWEYPADERFDSPGQPIDKANFPKLLASLRTYLREASDKTGKEYLLTAAVGCAPFRIDQSYDVKLIDRQIQFWHLMAYDLRMYGPNHSRRIGHHAPLRRSSKEGTEVERLNLEEIIQNFVAQGATRSKLVLGVGTYGKTFSLTSRAEHNLWDYAAGPGAADPFMQEAGTISYTGICYQIPLSKSRFEIHYDQEIEAPFAFNDTLWIGYDNPESAEKKVDLAYLQGLGGMMIWSIDMDDCKNLCEDWFSCPIITAIRDRVQYYQNQEGGWSGANSTNHIAPPKSGFKRPNA